MDNRGGLFNILRGCSIQEGWSIQEGGHIARVRYIIKSYAILAKNLKRSFFYYEVERIHAYVNICRPDGKKLQVKLQV